ncbi:MAG: hypothetical protein ACRC1J_11330, partial [Sandaracinobacteroides sp.]
GRSGSIVPVTGFSDIIAGDIGSPSEITAEVVFAPETIRGHGFGGGGTFSLVTPLLAFGSDAGTIAGATDIPLDFISSAGFGSYSFNSTKTRIFTGGFADFVPGFSAVAETQTLTVGAGETLRLTQALFPTILDSAQRNGLLALQTDGDLYSLLTPFVPDEAFDRRAANLTLGGLTELHVAKGGRIEGDAGAELGVARLLQEGEIRLPGGRLVQATPVDRFVPDYRSSPSAGNTSRPAIEQGIRSIARETPGEPSLADLLFPNSDGTLTALALTPIADPDSEGAEAGRPRGTNIRLATRLFPYFLGLLDNGQGLVLAPGSETDLSGTIVVNPRAPFRSQTDLTPVRQGRIFGGGTIANLSPGIVSTEAFGRVAYRSLALEIAEGAFLDLRGVPGTLALIGSDGAYVDRPVWSDSGTIETTAIRWQSDDVFAGEVVPEARGGRFIAPNPVLTAGGGSATSI